MTIPKQTYDKEKLRLTKPNDYWWDVILGGLLTSMILIPTGGLVLMKTGLTMWFYPYSILCVLIVVYYQWRDDNLTVIHTKLSKANNFGLVANCLDMLDWHYEETSTRFDLTLNKYILKFLKPTIIPESERILINFKYHSTYKTGRFPFFFGISSILKWVFTRKVKQQLVNKQPDKIIVDNKANA